jgi:amidase
MTDPTARCVSSSPVSRSDAGVLELLRLFADSQPTGDEYAAGCLQKARTLEPALKAFEYLPIDIARRPGPLSGIPVAIKDIIATSDMPTTNGSPIYAGHVPAADAWVVERLRHLGATIFGKTVSTEFAWRHPGPTVNPWNSAHTPGGSSSGSAAAVAAGLVPLASRASARIRSARRSTMSASLRGGSMMSRSPCRCSPVRAIAISMAGRCPALPSISTPACCR